MDYFDKSDPEKPKIHVSQSTPLIVACASEAYLPILANWLIALEVAGIDYSRVKIFAFDQITHDCAESWGIDAEQISWDGTIANFWLRRAEIFLELLSRGVTFVHSDLDAIWLKDPFPMLSTLGKDVDLIFSQGTWWPKDIHKEQGFVLCCGWFLARATEASLRFFSDVVADLEQTHDDQVSVNRLLFERKIKWTVCSNAAYHLEFRGAPIRCWSESVFGECPDGGPSVAMLPHRLFQRIEDDANNIFVNHPLSPKSAAAKLASFEEAGLLYLDAPDAAVAGKPLRELART
uniref:Nucleotide-diphospho-sugar transferase n=1 Tax=Candidatus Kentrum sp. DK TaxID=2126562 RepID=A0A450T6T3_9GAMM|nr:MAG: Nucleotide-diphospho-sugar transferase [Candidatus Kentron sp. DK]